MKRAGLALAAVILTFATAAMAQNYCQIECRRVQPNGQSFVTKRCLNVGPGHCAQAARDMSRGPTSCHGYMTPHCVNN